MRKFVFLSLLSLLMLPAAPASADFFALELDAQAGYARFDNIEYPQSIDGTTLAGGTFGVRGKLEILFLNAVFDYQHFINNADYLHAGLGMDFRLPTPGVEPFFRASAGLMLLTAGAEAFDPQAAAKLVPTVGFQARAGAGLEIPLGGFFALGAAADVGYHYITAKHGWDLSVQGYFGLRI